MSKYSKSFLLHLTYTVVPSYKASPSAMKKLALKDECPLPKGTI